MAHDDSDSIKKIFENAPVPTGEGDTDGDESAEGGGTGGGRVKFPGISGRAYEHPADKAAMAALRKISGFDEVLKRLTGMFSERSIRFLFLANAVRVDERQFSKLHGIWLECCEILDMEPPELYVTHALPVNAGAIGISKPFVVLNSGSIESLDEDHIRFVLGHELAHILSGHMLNRTMLFLLLRVVLPLLQSLPFAGLVLRGVIFGLLEWSRKAELSCDRAGLLCLQDPDKAYALHMVMAGGKHLDQMDVDAFIEQAREYETGGDIRDNLIKLLAGTRTTHPYPVLRLAELKRWVESGDYARIMDGEYPIRTEDGSERVSEAWTDGASSYKDGWANREDALGKLVQDFSEFVGGKGADVWEQVRDFFNRAGGSSAASADGDGEAQPGGDIIEGDFRPGPPADDAEGGADAGDTKGDAGADGDGEPPRDL